jgi:hypothetical protein
MTINKTLKYPEEIWSQRMSISEAIEHSIHIATEPTTKPTICQADHIQLACWLTQLRSIERAYSSFKKKWEILDIEHAATPDGEYDFFKKDMLLYDLEESIGATLNGDPSTSVRL